MEQILEHFSLSLRCLCILNITRIRHSLLALGCFLNLAKLVVSPQQISDDTLQLIAQLEHLQVLILLQDHKTQGHCDLYASL